MAHYNFLERRLARVLSRFPYLKALIKAGYSRAVFLRAKKSYRIDSVTPVETVIGEIQDGQCSFFGYYDKSPVNRLGVTLVHRTQASSKQAPDLKASVHVAVVDSYGYVEDQVPVSVYNWQQGARAQWISDDLFMFNDYEGSEKRYVARVYSVSSRCEVKRFDSAV